MRIGLISDTHNHFDPRIASYFAACDEIWHAGDVGSFQIIEALERIAPVKCVFGNIDGPDIRGKFPERLQFNCEGLEVYMIHIGGKPPKYASGVLSELKKHRPKLFICGHSHILKIMPDHNLDKMLYLNPGAAGNHGFHKMKTIVRFEINRESIKNLEVIELGLRGKA